MTLRQRSYLIEGGGAIVLRQKGFGVTTKETYELLDRWKNSNVVWRGMTGDEYKNTVGKRKPIYSTKKYSFGSEGTSFSNHPGDAESYVNFGRDDPRKTGKPNYLVKVNRAKTMYRDTDGYIKSKEPVPYSEVIAVWEMGKDKKGDLVARKIK